jgi:hypothetical protein
MSNATNLHMGSHAGQRSGWVSFAGYLMIVAGLFHAIAGLVALFKPTLYVATNSQLLAFNYTTWGWVHLLFGFVLIASSASLFAGRMWGRILAITLATFSAIANFGFIWAYPLWSITIIVLDIMIIYAVATHGRSETYEADEAYDE